MIPRIGARVDLFRTGMVSAADLAIRRGAAVVILAIPPLT